jgi:hypothetical protein
MCCNSVTVVVISICFKKILRLLRDARNDRPYDHSILIAKFKVIANEVKQSILIKFFFQDYNYLIFF